MNEVAERSQTMGTEQSMTAVSKIEELEEHLRRCCEQAYGKSALVWRDPFPNHPQTELMMAYAEGYRADPLTKDDLVKKIIADTNRGNEPIPPYLSAKDIRCMAIDIHRLRYEANHG